MEATSKEGDHAPSCTKCKSIIINHSDHLIELVYRITVTLRKRTNILTKDKLEVLLYNIENHL